MGRLNGYIQRSLSFRPHLYKKLAKCAEKDRIPNYAVVEAALDASIQRGQIKKQVIKAAIGRKASISRDYKYIPVYVNDEAYRTVKVGSVMSSIPMYILIEEIIIRHVLGKRAYRKYVEKHFQQRA